MIRVGKLCCQDGKWYVTNRTILITEGCPSILIDCKLIEVDMSYRFPKGVQECEYDMLQDMAVIVKYHRGKNYVDQLEIDQY